MTAAVSHTLVIPVYRNEAYLPELLRAIEGISAKIDGRMEAVFVIDGSPDRSEEWLLQHLTAWSVPSQLVALSRNFGSFTAIRVGLAQARGEYIAVMAADLQEPPGLVTEFFRVLGEGRHDVAVGTRASRADPLVDKAASGMFWRFYRALVQQEMPAAGIDMFAVTRKARDALLRLEESHSSLVAQLLWIGFGRAEVPYDRLARSQGESGWTLRKKLRYLFDSIFSFTDIPITLLTLIGFAGTFAFLVLGAVLLVLRLAGVIEVQGYTAIMVAILFSASLILFGLGIVGNYVWRTYENTKQRPLGIIRAQREFGGGTNPDGRR
ncbi:MAG: glycosyltransferase family 2 protein [Burkholderiales bacterium]